MCKPLMRPLILQARFFLVAKPPGTRLSRNLHTQKTLAPLWLRGRSSPYPHGVRLPLYPWILEPLTLSSNKHGSPSGPETAATGPRAQSRVPRREVTGGSRAPTNSARREDPRRERGCTPRQVAPPSPEVGPGTFSPRATRGSKAGSRRRGGRSGLVVALPTCAASAVPLSVQGARSQERALRRGHRDERGRLGGGVWLRLGG